MITEGLPVAQNQRRGVKAFLLGPTESPHIGGTALGSERGRFEHGLGDFKKVRGCLARTEGADFDHCAVH